MRWAAPVDSLMEATRRGMFPSGLTTIIQQVDESEDSAEGDHPVDRQVTAIAEGDQEGRKPYHGRKDIHPAAQAGDAMPL